MLADQQVAPAIPPRLTWFKSWLGLVRWSIVRHKYLIPVFTLIQALFAVAIVYGLALLIPDVDQTAAGRLASGAWTLGIIAVGCVLAPQIVNTSKLDGLLDYQRTLPVPRSAILLADMVVWSVAALPGIVVGVAAGAFRFNLDLQVSAATVVTFLLVIFTATAIGYTIAYWFAQNVVGLLTQVIMIGALLFAPITFPAERLPEWVAALHQYLPFAPMGDLIRAATLRSEGQYPWLSLLVMAAWAVLAYAAAYSALRRRL